jgi:hypothetical protein
VASFIVFFIFIGLLFFYLRARQLSVSIKGLFQATALVLGLVFVFLFLTVANEEFGLRVNAEEIVTWIIVLIIILQGYRSIPKNLFKEREIQLDIFIFSK